MAKLLVITNADFSSVAVKQVEPLSKIHIEVVASPNNGGIVTGSGGYDIGETVTISASPKNGYTFSRWNDGVTTPERSVIVGDTDAIYTAIFKEAPYFDYLVGKFYYPSEKGGHNSIISGKTYGIISLKVPEGKTSCTIHVISGAHYASAVHFGTLKKFNDFSSPENCIGLDTDWRYHSQDYIIGNPFTDGTKMVTFNIEVDGGGTMTNEIMTSILEALNPIWA